MPPGALRIYFAGGAYWQISSACENKINTLTNFEQNVVAEVSPGSGVRIGGVALNHEVLSFE
jgi:hypothetical protein